jgi:hypothetical protein
LLLVCVWRHGHRPAAHVREAADGGQSGLEGEWRARRMPRRYLSVQRAAVEGTEAAVGKVVGLEGLEGPDGCRLGRHGWSFVVQFMVQLERFGCSS